MNVRDRKFLENLISKYSKKELSKNILYPLIDDAFSTIDILKGMEVMLTGKITMLEITQQFEYEFAKYILNAAGINVKVKPIQSSESPSVIVRPRSSILRSVHNKVLPLWEDAIERYVKDVQGIK